MDLKVLFLEIPRKTYGCLRLFLGNPKENLWILKAFSWKSQGKPMDFKGFFLEIPKKTYVF